MLDGAHSKSRGVLTTQTVRLPMQYNDFDSGQLRLALLRLPLAVAYSTTLTTFGPTDARAQLVPIEVLRNAASRVARLVTEAPQSGLVVSFDLDNTGIPCPTDVPGGVSGRRFPAGC